MITVCPGCGSENDARRRFCNACGGGLEVICRCCGFSNRSGDRFCGGCGIRLEGLSDGAAQTAATAVTTPAAAAGLDQAKRDELRTITVMMADLDGFAEMTDVHGRERQTAVMNVVFERLAEHHIVLEFDGYIDKFLDGDIMALFGAPIAHEDAPERALRAAVRMHEELRRLHEEGVIPADTPLRLRIGLNTGPVRVGGVGAGGRMEYTAMGDTVNLAARLMTACQWGQTLISSNTHRRAVGSFELEELPPVKVKGKAQPVPIWAVLAEKRRAARVELAEAAGMSRMIGREDLLEEVCRAYEEASAGRGQVVGICGEAGIGKSRLVFEVHHHVVAGAARFVEGRCLSYGANISYLPIRDVLNELLALSDSDSAEERYRKVREALGALGLEVDRLAPAIGRVLGLEAVDEAFEALDPQERRERLKEAFWTTLHAVAADKPLIVFFDDLQWCDADSRELVDDLVAHCAQAPVLVFVVYRPDFTHDYDRFEHYRLVAPQRLDPDQTRQVVGSLLFQRGLIEDESRIDDSLAQAVFHKSQGNPFFIDQTVTALIERAEQTGRPTIDFRRGRLLIHEDELHDLVPDSVEEILLARIDRLPEEPRSLMQAASVAMVGRYFRRSALEFLLELPEAELQNRLGVLLERELIRRAGQSEQDEEYVFEHALARDVAYNALLRAERRRLHGRVGEYIEDHYASSLEAYIDDLSYHYYNSSYPHKALTYLPQSAARAARIFSNRQAVLHYKRALEKADEVEAAGGMEGLPQIKLEVLKGLTGVQALTGDREGLKYGRVRIEVAQQIGDDDTVLDASYMLAHQYTEAGQFDEARRYWDMVLAQYEQRQAWDGVRDTEFGIGNLYAIQGHYAVALEHFERARAIQVEKMEFDPFYQWVATNNLAAAYEAMGQFGDALRACDECIELLARMPDDDPMRMRLECYTVGVRGSAQRNTGNLTEALQSYGRTLEIVQATGEKNVEAEVRHWLGRTLIWLGRLREAQGHLDESVALARETGHGRWEASSLAGLADIAVLCGEFDSARDLLGQARDVLARVGELAGAGDIGIVEGRLMLALDRPADAAERLREVVRMAAEGHQEVERARAMPDLALAEHLCGADEAEARSLHAVELSRSMGMRPTLARALLVRAQMLLGRDDAECLRLVEDALELADAMGTVEQAVAALGLRARVRAGDMPEAARADLEEAVARLAVQEAHSGPAYVEATRRRHLEPALAALPTS